MLITVIEYLMLQKTAVGSPESLDAELNDVLLVTIFVDPEAPYTEFKWKPNYNGHITRLIMPYKTYYLSLGLIDLKESAQ